MTTRRATAGLLLALLLLPLPRAAAHDMAAKRRLLVAVEGSKATLLVAMEVAAGAEAERLATTWELDGDPSVLSPAERLARAQLLLPRLRQGWTFEVEHRPMAGELSRFEVAMRPGLQPSRGFEVMAAWEVALPPAPLHLAVLGKPGGAELQGEFQVQPPWTVRVTELPRDPNGWLVGPFTVDAQQHAWVELDRLAQPAATGARPLPAAPQRPPLPAAATPPKR